MIARPQFVRFFAALTALVALAAAPVGWAQAQPRGALLPDFTELYEKQAPAVVSIDVTQKARAPRGIQDLSEDDPFYEFFRRFGQIPRPRGGPGRGHAPVCRPHIPEPGDHFHPSCANPRSPGTQPAR